MSERRLTVFLNVPSPQLHGGPATHLPLLEQELRKHVDLKVFEYGRKTDSETTLDKLVGRTKDLVKLRAKISRSRPSVIHHNTAFDTRAIIRDAALVWLARRYGIPVLLKMHGSLDELFGEVSPPLDRLRNVVLRNADCIGVLSEVEMRKFLSAWPFLDGRVRVVKNIIKPDFYAVERREAEHPTVLFISRFIRQKGIFELLEAVPGVLKKFPATQFVFVGSGNDAAEFDARVRHKQLMPSVRRIGHLSNVETTSFYSSAWTLVFPTHFPEGMPMVVAEAMAAGVPIITTKTNFSRSYMSAGQHCLYLERKDSGSIEDQVVYLLGNRDLRQRMSTNNRELAKSFRADIVTADFLDIYENVQLGRIVRNGHVNQQQGCGR
jgi:glycosyltransferase involved in cell wall biosynthesis